MNSFFRKLSWLAQRRRKEQELREELQFHLDEEAVERRGAGLPEPDALWAARRELGNATQLREDTRAAWGWTLVEQLGQDLRYAFRTMAGNRLFTLLAVLSLALGIGANTAIYSFMDSILLRSLPVSDPESLVVLNWHARQTAQWRSFVMHSINGWTHDDPKSGTTAGIFPYPAFELFQKNDALFSSIFAYHPAPDLNVTFRGQADVARGEYVSGDYFRGLAVLPAAGRLILPDDDRTGAPAVAVISFSMSKRRFGGPANAAGQSILINNLPFMVTGVTPPGFFGVDPGSAPDVYLPIHADLPAGAGRQYRDQAEQYFDPNYYWIEVMARLRPGGSLIEAQAAALAPAFQNWVATTAGTDAERANLPSLVVNRGAAGLDNLRRRYSEPLYVLLALVGLILAIACANVANLLLARAAARRREIALRLSVGAGRFRVVRQLLTESVLLASLGGLLGILFAIWGIRFLTVLLANGDEGFTLHPELNWRVLAVAIALSLLTGVLFGLAPAMQSTRVDVISAMKETRAGQPVARRLGISLSHTLVIGQISLSLLMLVAAGLFVRTMANLESIQVGFNRENLLLFELDARKAGHKDPEITAFYGDLLKRFSAIPGVRDASLSNQPLIEAGFGLGLVIHGKPASGAGNRMLVVGPGFMQTMQIPMVAGRDIDQRDQPGSPPVAIVSELFAKVNFGDENPLGQHVALESGRGRPSSRDMEIVGIVKNVRYGGLKDKARPVIYIPYNQGVPRPEEMVYELRTAGDPLALVNTVREIVHQADSRVPVTEVKTQVEEIDQTINQEIVFAELCTAFAILALVIACVGLYGTISYNVARRTGEIGIRMALGAQRGLVVRMILRQVLVLAALGLAIGIPLAFGASKLVNSFLFGIKPNDPLALTAAVVILTGAAILAGYAPARRASRIDPMVALRHE